MAASTDSVPHRSSVYNVSEIQVLALLLVAGTHFANQVTARVNRQCPRNTNQLHVLQLAQISVTLLLVTGLTSCDQVVPAIPASLAARNHVVPSQHASRVGDATVLACVVVTDVDVPARQLHVTVRNLAILHQSDHTGQAVSVNTDDAQVLFDRSLALVDQPESTLRRGEIQRLVTGIQNQHRRVVAKRLSLHD